MLNQFWMCEYDIVDYVDFILNVFIIYYYWYQYFKEQ